VYLHRVSRGTSGYNLKMTMFWVVTPCRLAGKERRFGGICHLHVQLSRCMVLRNVSIYVRVFTASEHGTATSSSPAQWKSRTSHRSNHKWQRVYVRVRAYKKKQRAVQLQHLATAVPRPTSAERSETCLWRITSKAACTAVLCSVICGCTKQSLSADVQIIFKVDCFLFDSYTSDWWLNVSFSVF